MTSLNLGTLSEDPSQTTPSSELKQQGDHSNSIETDMMVSLLKLRSALFPFEESYTILDNGVRLAAFYKPPSGDNAPLIICHHGAGSSGMTFACFVKEIGGLGKDQEKPGVLTFDARGHGDSSSPLDGNFSLSAFTSDFELLLHEFSARHPTSNPVFLVGHSLGGAVMTEFVSKCIETPLNIKGLIVIDIVEETAVRALASLPLFLLRRPSSFSSYREAIKWHLSSRVLRNENSAKFTVCDLLNESDHRLQWKCDLSKVITFGNTWFKGFSQKFVECRFRRLQISKLLLLSSNETLDKDLMIGQMQGKYQLIVFQNNSSAGHFLQEDIPKQCALSIMDFIRRNSASFIKKEILPKTSWGGAVNP